MNEEATNYPLAELEISCEKILKGGGTFWMKFTCEHCGTRQTCEEKNKLFYFAHCEECSEITNTKEKGGNLLALLVNK